MDLESRLAHELIRIRPDRAAAALERVTPGEAAAALETVSAAQAATVLASLTPHAAAAVVDEIPPPRAADVLGELDQDVAARVARRLAEPVRTAVFQHLPGRLARALGTLLAFPEDSAGGLMDPEVLALPEDVDAAEALGRIRVRPETARYNVYVVDRTQRLVGVVNLREILLAPPETRLGDVMVRDPVHLPAHAPRAAVIAHPGWRRVHSLPVVDERGAYLGAVRYRTLRALEEQLLRSAGGDVDTGEALGELFAAGAAGLLEALTGAGRPRTEAP